MTTDRKEMAEIAYEERRAEMIEKRERDMNHACAEMMQNGFTQIQTKFGLTTFSLDECVDEDELIEFCKHRDGQTFFSQLKVQVRETVDAAMESVEEMMEVSHDES